jgi:hypothetical protein
MDCEERGCRKPSSTALEMILLRMSMAKMNNMGERGPLVKVHGDV